MSYQNLILSDLSRKVMGRCSCYKFCGYKKKVFSVIATLGSAVLQYLPDAVFCILTGHWREYSFFFLRFVWPKKQQRGKHSPMQPLDAHV